MHSSGYTAPNILTSLAGTSIWTSMVFASCMSAVWIIVPARAVGGVTPSSNRSHVSKTPPKLTAALHAHHVRHTQDHSRHELERGARAFLGVEAHALHGVNKRSDIRGAPNARQLQLVDHPRFLHADDLPERALHRTAAADCPSSLSWGLGPKIERSAADAPFVAHQAADL
eukprot:scaffold825_cov249-Pinguiococcus_pyrenoidosus.AAC.32